MIKKSAKSSAVKLTVAIMGALLSTQSYAQVVGGIVGINVGVNLNCVITPTNPCGPTNGGGGHNNRPERPRPPESSRPTPRPPEHRPNPPNYPPERPNYPPSRPNYPPERPNYPPSRPNYPPERPNYPPSRPNYPPERPNYPPSRPGDGYTERREVYLNRYVRNELIDLRSLAGLYGSRYSGSVIESVEVQLTDGDGYSSLQLLMDGYSEDQQSYLTSTTILRPYNERALDYNLSTVQLQVNGKLYISRITVNIRNDRDNHGGGDGRVFELSQPIQRTFYRGDRIDLFSVMNLGAYRGYRIDSIVVVGSSADYANYDGSLFINGFNEGDLNFDRTRDREVIQTRSQPQIGRGADSVMLNLNSQVYINQVRIRLIR